MNPTEALSHLLAVAGGEDSNASVGASVRSRLPELQALSMWLASFRDDPPKSMRNIKQRLASMAQAIEDQQGFQWDEYQQVCRDALLEIQARDRLLANARMALNAAAGKVSDASVHLHEAIRSLGV